MDGNSVSFFEMVAQDRLVPTLKPAFAYVLSSLARWYPRFSAPLINYREELFYGLVYLLEAHYLRAHSASFGEQFYGLKRLRTLHPGLAVPSAVTAQATITPCHSTLPFSPFPRDTADGAGSSGGGGGAIDRERVLTQPLSSGDRGWALLALVLVPYLRSKAENWYRAREDDLQLDYHSDGDYTAPASSNDSNSVAQQNAEMEQQQQQLQQSDHDRESDAGLSASASAAAVTVTDGAAPALTRALAAFTVARLRLLLCALRLWRWLRRAAVTVGAAAVTVGRAAASKISRRCGDTAFIAFPYVHAALEVGNLWFSLAYLFGGSRYFTPLHWLTSQAVVRLNFDDMQQQQQQQQSHAALSAKKPAAPFTPGLASQRRSTGTATGGFLAVTRRVLKLSRRGLSTALRWAAESAKWGILAAVFAFKVAEWWNSPANRAARAGRDRLPVPPPPPCPVPLPAAVAAAPATATGAAANNAAAAAATDAGKGKVTVTAGVGGGELQLAAEPLLRPAILPAINSSNAANTAKPNSNTTSSQTSSVSASNNTGSTSASAIASDGAFSLVPLPSDYSLCPLCLRTRENPAALATGFVFCYRCAVEWVRARGCCPVTGAAVDEEGVRKVYDQ